VGLGERSKRRSIEHWPDLGAKWRLARFGDGRADAMGERLDLDHDVPIRIWLGATGRQ
jgi:hypothetical protein